MRSVSSLSDTSKYCSQLQLFKNHPKDVYSLGKQTEKRQTKEQAPRAPCAPEQLWWAKPPGLRLRFHTPLAACAKGGLFWTGSAPAAEGSRWLEVRVLTSPGCPAGSGRLYSSTLSPPRCGRRRTQRGTQAAGEDAAGQREDGVSK